MDRFRYCYGKKRGQKVENDARWIALCEEKQKINLEFSDDEDSKDKENISLGRRPSRKISQSNKFFPSRSARPKLDLSDLEDCEGPNQSQDCIPSKPLPIEDEIRKTEDAFAKVFRISDDDEDDEDDDDTSGDGRVLDDQKDPSVGVDKHVVDDYQDDDDDDDDDRSDDDDDKSDEDDDETAQDYPDTIAQYSQSAHLVKHDEEEEDEESLDDDDDDDDDDEEDDDDAEDDENEDADGVSRSMLYSLAGEESCLNCPSTTEVTANSINNGNDDSDDGTDRDCDGARVSDAGSFVSSRVREAEYADGYEADDDTRFHDGQTVADGSVLSTQSDVFHDLELEDYTCNNTNVTCDSNGESLMTSIVDCEDRHDISAVDRNDSDSHNVTTSRYTCTDKSSIDVTCDTCAEDTSLESFDNDDSGGDDENVAIELCDTCIDRSSATEYSTYAEGTHLESFGSDVRGDDDDDEEEEEGDDRDYDSDANDDDASTLCDTCIGNSRTKSFSTFPDGTEPGSDDDPDCDYNDDDCENQATASCDTCIDTGTRECNTCAEETLLGPSGDDDVQSDVEDDDGNDDGDKKFYSKLYDTCINNSTFSCGTHLGSDDDSSNDCYDNGNDDDEDDNKIEASDTHGDDDDNEEDNEVSVMCDTCITLSSTNDCSTLSNSAHLEGSNDDDDKNDVTVYSCIDKPNTCTSNEGTHSRRFVDDNDVHGDDNDVHGNDNDDDENSASDLFSTCTGYFTRGCSSTFRTDGTHLHGDVDDDDDCDNGDHDNDVKVVNSNHPCRDVSQVKCSSSNHSYKMTFFDSDNCHDNDKESNNHDNTNASPKAVTTMTCNDDFDTSHRGDGEDDRADDCDDDDNDGDGSSVEITILSRPSMLPNRHVSDKDDDDDDAEGDKSFEANIVRDEDVQEVSCNFDDQCNNETIKDDDKDEDVTIVLCDSNDNGTLKGDIDDISDDIHHDKLVHKDIVTRTVDRDVTTEHVAGEDEDDGEMAAEDDIMSLVNLSVVEVSSKRDKRAKRKSSWRVFVGNDNNNNSGDDDDDVDKKPTCLNETASVRRSVNPRFSIARVEDDVRKLSESLQALDVRDINGSTDTHGEILKFCGQRKTLNFSSVFTRKWIKSCKKIGEGAYAEVFEVAKSDEVMAIKVIPVRDDVGDSDQQSFREILFEMTISRELTRLRAKADGFVDLRSVWFVSGKYPKVLMDAWDEYDDAKNSENDRPDFTKDQHYVVLGFEMAGSPLESFGLTDHLQVLSIVKQTSLSLAIAENDLSFEHRDLHLGNVLVKSVDRDRVLSFVHLGRRFELPSRGLKVTIIDYTLSRMTRDGCTFFKDLSTDNSLFEGEGDIQYDVYRHMRTATGDNWNNFTPVTNVLWLKHMVDKILTFAQQCRRSEGHSKVLQHIIDLTTNLSNELERCRSACEFVERSSIFSDHPLQSPLGS